MITSRHIDCLVLCLAVEEMTTIMEIQVLKQLTSTRDKKCAFCDSRDEDLPVRAEPKQKLRLLFECEGDGESLIGCSACLRLLRDAGKITLEAKPGVAGIAGGGIDQALDSTLGEPDWTNARGLLLPYYKNRGQVHQGEWILTRILDGDGRVLERDDASLGIYPNRQTANDEVGRYLLESGATKPLVEFVNIASDVWDEIDETMRLVGEDLVWSIFARSASNEDLRRYLGNVRKGLSGLGR